MANAVLSRLAATPATELPRVAADGVRPVHTLYLEGLGVGLTDTAARDDVECLYRVFDIALAHGLGCVVLDYILEVCSDPAQTSRYTDQDYQQV